MECKYCTDCGMENELLATTCWKCNTKFDWEDEYIINEPPMTQQHIPFDPALCDPNKLAREFWNYFCETLKSDMVISKDKTIMTIATNFDDIGLDTATNFIEAMKHIVVIPFAQEMQRIEFVAKNKTEFASSEEQQEQLNLDLPDLPDVKKRCYGCNRLYVGGTEFLCQLCKGSP